MAVAVFKNGPVLGEVIAQEHKGGVQLKVHLTKLPPGKHGFHIHTAGDLRGEGCKGACAHWSKAQTEHGDFGKGHTGDLGNIEPGPQGEFKRSYHIDGITVDELWGRTIIVHEDEDDLGLGGHDDSKTTGHSGKRIACAIFGRMQGCEQKGGHQGFTGSQSRIEPGLLIGGIAVAGLAYLVFGSGLNNRKRSK